MAGEKDVVGADRTAYSVQGGQNRWIAAATSDTRLLLDREQDRAWRLSPQLWLLAASQDRLLLRECHSQACIGIVTDSNFKEVARLDGVSEPVFFSPGGDKLLFGSGEAIYLVDLATATKEILFESADHNDWGTPTTIDFSPVRAGQEILVRLRYPAPAESNPWQEPYEWYRFG